MLNFEKKKKNPTHITVVFLQFQTYYTGLLKSVRPTCDVFCIIYSHCLTGKIGRFMLKNIAYCS